MPKIPHLSIPFLSLATFSFFSLYKMSDSTNGAEVQPSKAVMYTSLQPLLYVEAPKAHDAVQFFKAAFDAEEVKRDVNPKRKADQEQPLLVSVELKIGSFSFLVADLTEDVPHEIKSVYKGSVIRLESEEVEAAVAKAVSAGAISTDEAAPADGERALCDGGVAKLKDPYGNLWIISAPRKLEPYDVQPQMVL
ncbi:hypothetical protein LIER_17151 [Lithospermum erythrorhizon]|uniref:Early tobacco anther 1 n=1 Tax=Lithospermum erythrorhizon TaxID=34254 RepID=A0AAV3Q9A6_LITER